MRGVFLLILLLALSSCSSYTFIEVEVINPPTLNISPNTTNILLIDNSPIQPHIEGCQIKIGERNQKLYQNLDSLSVKLLDRCSSVVDSISPYLSLSRYPKKIREDSLYINVRTIDSLQMLEIGRDSDIIISLSSSRISSLCELNQLYGGGYIARSKGEFITLLEVYNPITSTITENKVDIMPFEFVSADLDYQKAIYDSSPENRLDELIYAKIDRLMPMILPHSNYVNRMIVLSNDQNMRDALRFTRDGNWNDASIIWEYMIENSRVKSIRLASFVNLALYYEFESRFYSSIHMISEARKLVRKHQVQLIEYLDMYEKELKERSLTN
ncbi:MAG: DUF6340 family protein [Bacteroidales bacterium]